MSNEAESYLEKIKQKIRGLQDEIKKAKIAANAIAEMDGVPAPYQKVDDEEVVVSTSFQTDEFYGQPLAKCVRRILEARRALNSGPASVNEIHDALLSGGYRFDTKDEANSKSSLRVSLSKNPLFHKLPNGGWGLLAWYPKAKAPKENGAATDKPDEAQAAPVAAKAEVEEPAEGGDEK